VQALPLPHRLPRCAAPALLALALALAACNGGGPYREAAAPGPGLDAADLNFLSQAIYGDIAAIDLGRMARRQAADPAVRDIARQLVAEHRDSVHELASLAESRAVDLPDSLNAGRAAVDDRLGDLSGPEFDVQYLQQQIADHEVAVTLYQNEADRGGDPELRDFAHRWLPTLERRADQLRALSDRLAGVPEPTPVPPASPAAPSSEAPPAATPPPILAPEDLPPPGGDAGEPPPEQPPPRIEVP
jgi:putative membrane protein